MLPYKSSNSKLYEGCYPNISHIRILKFLEDLGCKANRRQLSKEAGHLKPSHHFDKCIEHLELANYIWSTYERDPVRYWVRYKVINCKPGTLKRYMETEVYSN